MIDGGTLRTSRSTDRQAAYRSASVRPKQKEPAVMEPAMPAEQPRQQYRTAEPEQRVERVRKAPASGQWTKATALVIGALLLAAGGWFFLSNQRSLAATIDSEKYQAVFLSNSQVYFGKLSNVNGDYMKLTNVFYLERQLTANTSSEDANDDEQNVSATDNN